MKRSFSCNYVSLIAFLLLAPVLAYGQSDIFEIRTPNVMIIFDSSSSMEMTPNESTAGQANLAVDSDGRYPATETHPNSYWFEAGGNSPLSKLYVAKYALRYVIKDLENVNIGFSTYGQRKQEQWRGQYKKWVIIQSAQPEYCSKRYWRWRTVNNEVDGPKSSTNFLSNQFLDTSTHTNSGINFTDPQITQTNVSVGHTFTRMVNVYDKANSSIPPHSNLKMKSLTITYQVTNITFNAEFGWWVYTYDSSKNPYSYDWYDETILTISGCTGCSNDKLNDPFPNPWPSTTWTTYFKGDAEYNNPYVGKKPANYWKCSHTNAVPEQWGWSTQYRTYLGTQAAVCQNTADGWQYVGNCCDASNYYYPIGPAPASPYDSTNRPHTWSYFKITGNSWTENSQPSPYYPAPDDIPGNQDNNYFFTNFPSVDDSSNGYQVRNKIASWLDVSPAANVKNPETGYWNTKSPLRPNSVTSNTIVSQYTPLADSFYWAKKYFNDYIYNYNGGDDASKSGCRGNYVILMTDGLESARVNADGTPKLQDDYDSAKALLDLVKDKNGNSIGVKTYVIGFGAGFQGNNATALNNIASAGGTSSAYFASDLEGLVNAFKNIFQAIGGSYGRSNPVTARDWGTIYRGYFNLPGWEGHLVAYQLMPNGTLGAQKWDAGKQMNINGRGPVYTWVQQKVDPNRENFSVGNVNKLDSSVNNNPPEDLDWNPVIHVIGDGKIDKNDSITIINFIPDASYGYYNDGTKDVYPYAGTRSFNWKLGDIYHSTPTVVGAPALNVSDSDFPKPYSQFKTSFNNRETVVYVGANDGMLHAFGADGNEKFAVIPNNLLSDLKRLRNGHRFFVDSSPRAFDIFRKGNWRTIIVSGERAGGDHYFAIDVTDPTAGGYPSILWQVNDASGSSSPTGRKMGNTWSRPEIGRIKINGNETFAVFVGGGYSQTENVGNTFYAINMQDGSFLRTFDVGDSSDKVPAGATAFDIDNDGHIDAVYFGDYNGTLWKIAIVGNDQNSWKLVKLYDPSTDTPALTKYPIFYPPAVTMNNKGEVLIYFGQGDETNLFENTNIYYFFEIKDPRSNVDGSGVRNWSIKLDANGAGEKVLASASVANNVVYFTTWQYTGIGTNCGAGTGRLYGLTSTTVEAQGGLTALFYGVGGNELETPVKSIDLGIGIPSAPVVIPGRIYISTSANANNIVSIPIPAWGKGKLKYWREVF